MINSISLSSGGKNKPRLGFLGLGWIGLDRMRIIAEGGNSEIVAVADFNSEALATAAKVVPSAFLCASLENLLHFDLDGIVIATPSALHARQCVELLEAGKAVFCQKPLGRSEAEVREVITVAKTSDRLLRVDLSYRHIVGLQRIRQLIRSGELGDIFAVNLIFHNAYGPDKPWFYNLELSGGGCTIDLGIHLVDALYWILGEKVELVESSLYTHGKPWNEASNKVEDCAIARLILATGATVNLECSWRLHAGQDADIRMTFYGTQGGAKLSNINGSFYDFQAEHLTGTQRKLIAEPPDSWGGGAIRAWESQLIKNSAFDEEIETQIEAAAVLDSIYDRAEVLR